MASPAVAASTAARNLMTLPLLAGDRTVPQQRPLLVLDDQPGAALLAGRVLAPGEGQGAGQPVDRLSLEAVEPVEDPRRLLGVIGPFGGLLEHLGRHPSAGMGRFDGPLEE